MCNPAAKRSGAKSGSEFREAKVKCTQSHPLLSFYLLNASQISFPDVYDNSCAQEHALIDQDKQSGWWMVVWSDKILATTMTVIIKTGWAR
jgi:hypothetical protein